MTADIKYTLPRVQLSRPSRVIFLAEKRFCKGDDENPVVIDRGDNYQKIGGTNEK